MPLNSTNWGVAPAAPMPMTRARFDTKPSFAPKTAARKVPESRRRPRAASPRTTSWWIFSSAAIAGVANGSSLYGERPSAFWASASTKIDPKLRAIQARSRVPSPGRGSREGSPPSRPSQCASWRPSASASARRMSRSSPSRRVASSR